ncbi:4'-phosphopantetheinyl transferase family protein [Arenibacterium sp. CAU 1754]
MMQERALSGQPLISISACRLDSDDDIPLDRACDLLNAQETERMERFVFDRDGARFARARGFLRRHLGEALNLAPQEVEIASRSGGKPFVPGAPFDFNLSHSGGLAVLGLSGTGSVGIDLELTDRGGAFRRDLDGLARAVLIEEERTALTGLNDADKAHRFFQFWTAKEARMKLSGQGLSLPPRQIGLSLRGGVPVGYSCPTVGDAQLEFVSLQHPSAICCVAYAQTRPEEWDT